MGGGHGGDIPPFFLRFRRPLIAAFQFGGSERLECISLPPGLHGCRSAARPLLYALKRGRFFNVCQLGTPVGEDEAISKRASIRFHPPLHQRQEAYHRHNEPRRFRYAGVEASKKIFTLELRVEGYVTPCFYTIRAPCVLRRR